MAGTARRELKYAVGLRQLLALRRDLGALLPADPHADAEGGYLVESIYFESPDFYLVREKLGGWPRRARLRVRRYGPGSPLRLEIKRREGDLILKEHCPLGGDDQELLSSGLHGELLARARPPEELAVLRRFVTAKACLSAGPTCLVRYRREAFVHPAPELGLRITLDRALRVGPGGGFEGPTRALDPSQGVLEVKLPASAELPAWLRPLIARYELQPQPVSKFVRACLAVHAPRR